MSSSIGTAPLSLPAIRARVDAEVAAFVAQRRPTLEAISPDLADLLDIVSDGVSGGKRLRAAFVCVGWAGAGGQECDEVYRAAAAMEFLQACALIHDDIMDGSDSRRGLPSAHRRFGDIHRGQTWHGSAEQFGAGGAILAGDLCLSWADEALLTCGLEAQSLARAKPAFDSMRAELMAGQYLDLVEQARGGGDVQRARTVVSYKSARYTIARPLEIGGLLAAADSALLSAYQRYGLRLGEAFQLRDDVLGVFGDSAQTGKPVGDDLREGKQTLLIAATMQLAGPEDADLMRENLGRNDLDASRIERMQQVISESGALAQIEALIASGRDEALEACASVPEPAAGALRELAVAATSRRA